ncbi:MAG: PA0069 family radical SAM protein [Planctomycetes bacterium]|nr:PA0069 family radical SAM protein [Planctomycetota bacterium]
MKRGERAIHGRGTGENPKCRFDEIEFVPDQDVLDEEAPLPRTRFFRDASRSILSWNDSPDLPYTVSVNPYRGCEHGCIYCYARPYHEYLGFSAGLDFESKIMVKEDAPELLRRELMKESWRPEPVNLSGVTDCYQPIERTLGLTRRCLEVLAEFRNPVEVCTKGAVVTRDLDLLAGLAAIGAARVALSITTLDAALAGILEPRAARPEKRIEAIAALAGAGVPVSVMAAPVIPGLNDHELPDLLAAARKAGARSAGYQVVRLPFGVADLFERWLEEHLPERRTKVLHRIRDMRGGRLTDARFGHRMRGEGVFANEIESLFLLARHKAGFREDGGIELSSAHFRRPGPAQGMLFPD